MKRAEFTILESTAVPLPLANIDTDQIIPARFLSATGREGFGNNLFRDWRYDADGNPVPGFVLNRPEFRGEILIAGSNFGCGSSREHAVWAITGHDFRAVVSDSFADIFMNNALNNGLLTVTVTPEFLAQLTGLITSKPETIVRVDLPGQVITVPGSGLQAGFPVNPFRKECLIKGLDNIDYLLSMKEDIMAFEKNRQA
ncbi:MAG: 3-isopropylmalate dehydratase small subunit [Bacteroidales bacterium]|jgi:3-isopropylmalate/(R)-2-methylmalate dehydratase small subunit|nr:3-isopropylmalate dehydratase small subunit [Bacteroidales bacterium]MDX9927802.1 3-isopropylmalate dehydratase small subunit [Bacteroidales bacterium]HNX83802.1 3-isopropylmalate dehydratase small subunit [Bacteroidales bacterium]HOC48402.1 3-isopropylmalate dehydratase small subunit [Bacteroidales bacterium]HPS97895.1 3-isopropylmalate dehydratase small subunit [Bacteroidales bacterium]